MGNGLYNAVLFGCIVPDDLVGPLIEDGEPNGSKEEYTLPVLEHINDAFGEKFLTCA